MSNGEWLINPIVASRAVVGFGIPTSSFIRHSSFARQYVGSDSTGVNEAVATGAP